MNKILDRLVVIFFSTIILYEIIAVWIGQIWFNSFYILLIAFILAVTIIYLYPFKIHTPFWIYGIGLLFAAIFALPTLFLHAGVPASADPFHTIMIRVITHTLPRDFTPYSLLPYVYPFGFHLFAKSVIDIVRFIPDYQVLWLLGLFFIIISPALYYHFFRQLTKSQTAGIWAAVILFGNKITVSNFYYGIYPEFLGFSLFLFSFCLFQSKHPLFWLSLSAIYIVHPISAVLAVTFYLLYFILNKHYKNLIILPFTVLLAIPTVWTYFLAGKTIIQPAPGITSFSAKGIRIWELFNWIGPLPSFLFFTSLCFFIIKRKTLTGSDKRLYTLFILLALLMLTFIFATPLYPWKMVHILAFTFLGLSVLGLTALTHDFSIIKKEKVIISGVFIAIILFTMFTSTTLRSLYLGNKISKDEIKTAKKLAYLLPKKNTVLFLGTDYSTSHAVMAMMTDTVPFGLGGYFLPEDPPLISHPAYIQRKKEEAILSAILKEKCISCIESTGVEFIVANQKHFPYPLPYKVIKSIDNFTVYKR